jgi:hypothetical protein
MTDYKFKLKTVQTNVFKGLVEALKEIITETNIEISKKGIRISAIILNTMNVRIQWLLGLILLTFLS